VIYEGEKDAVMAFISSKIPSEPSEVDILITKGHPSRAIPKYNYKP
jgi:hypothetical protein